MYIYVYIYIYIIKDKWMLLESLESRIMDVNWLLIGICNEN